MWLYPRTSNAGRIIAVLVLLSVGGCGYTLSHRLKDSFREAKEGGVHVPVFKNRTDEVGAERIFTDALIRELQSRGEVVIRDRDKATLEFQGEIISIGAGPTAYTAPNFPGLQSYRRIPSELGVGVVLRLSVTTVASGQVLWVKEFQGFRRLAAPVNRTYNYQIPSSLGLLTQSLIDSSYADIAGDIMRDVYDEMVEIF